MLSRLYYDFKTLAASVTNKAIWQRHWCVQAKQRRVRQFRIPQRKEKIGESKLQTKFFCASCKLRVCNDVI